MTGPSARKRTGQFSFVMNTMAIPYTKPHLSVDQQIALLRSRGMEISDSSKAANYLKRIGYYRLSGYWHPFRKPIVSNDKSLHSLALSDNFRDGTCFSDAVDLYVFDKKLRLLFLDAIERIEIALRVDIASYLGARDIFAHRNKDLLHGNFTKKVNPKTGKTEHADWLIRFDQTALHSREEFIIHYRNTYNSPLPIWIAVEVWDFGMLSKFLSGMQNNHLTELSEKYDIKRPELLTSWVRSINHVRNICAHHGRLWNRSLTDRPKQPKPDEIPNLNHLIDNEYANYRLYGVAAIVRYLLQKINPTTSWHDRLRQHFDSFPFHSESSRLKHVSISHTGFPEGWIDLPLWSTYPNGYLK